MGGPHLAGSGRPAALRRRERRVPGPRSSLGCLRVKPKMEGGCHTVRNGIVTRGGEVKGLWIRMTM